MCSLRLSAVACLSYNCVCVCVQSEIMRVHYTGSLEVEKHTHIFVCVWVCVHVIVCLYICTNVSVRDIKYVCTVLCAYQWKLLTKIR